METLRAELLKLDDFEKAEHLGKHYSGKTNKELSNACGKSESWVSKIRSMNKAHPTIIKAGQKGNIQPDAVQLLVRYFGEDRRRMIEVFKILLKTRGKKPITLRQVQAEINRLEEARGSQRKVPFSSSIKIIRDGLDEAKRYAGRREHSLLSVVGRLVDGKETAESFATRIKELSHNDEDQSPSSSSAA